MPGRGTLWAGIFLLVAQAHAGASERRRLDESPASFHGPAVVTSDTGSVVIGVLAPAAQIAGQEMLAAVQWVVDRANEGGGIGGRSLKVVARSDDRPWHSAAHEVTRLIREDGAVAIVGGLDGARAHAAELIVAKLWVPLLCTTAADRSVDVANVPWVFRFAPDEHQQMAALAQVAVAHQWRRLQLVTDDEREGRLAARALDRLAHESGFQISLLDHRQNTQGLPPADATILWTGRENATQWLSRQPPDGRALLLPLQLAAADVRRAAGDRAVWAVAVEADETDAALESAWRQSYGVAPSAGVLLTTEAAQLLVSLLNQDMNPVPLRRALASQPRFGPLGGWRGVVEARPLMFR